MTIHATAISGGEPFEGLHNYYVDAASASLIMTGHIEASALDLKIPWASTGLFNISSWLLCGQSEPYYSCFKMAVERGTPNQNGAIRETLCVVEISTQCRGDPGAPGIKASAAWGDHIFATVPDTDGDGVVDVDDNCIATANNGPSNNGNALEGAQCDSDGDGYGNRCDGDMNNNSTTNAQDYVLFRQQLGQPSVAPMYNKADINCNGTVNAQDYVLFRSLLGQQSGPSGLVP